MGERVGHVPCGYTLGEDEKTLIESPREQEAIALIQRLRAVGCSYRGISRQLVMKGYEPKEGAWHHQKIKNILEYQKRKSGV